MPGYQGIVIFNFECCHAQCVVTLHPKLRTTTTPVDFRIAIGSIFDTFKWPEIQKIKSTVASRIIIWLSHVPSPDSILANLSTLQASLPDCMQSKNACSASTNLASNLKFVSEEQHLSEAPASELRDVKSQPERVARDVWLLTITSTALRHSTPPNHGNQESVCWEDGERGPCSFLTSFVEVIHV
jgi:hypothetical protein